MFLACAKKSELEKFFILDQKNPLLNQIIKDFYIKLGMQNEAEFDKYLSNYNLDIKKLKKKIEIETTWNRFVFDKYNKQINIDIKSLKRTVEKNQESQKNTKYFMHLHLNLFCKISKNNTFLIWPYKFPRSAFWMFDLWSASENKA